MARLPPGRILGRYSARHRGPLPPNIAATFFAQRYVMIQLNADTIVYRVGDAHQPWGQYFSLDRPRSMMQTRIDKAVRPEWPGGQASKMNTVFTVKVPAGTVIHAGIVAGQGGVFVGGTRQLVIRQPWQRKGIEIIGSEPFK